MSKRFPFTKRAIEALEAHDPDSPSREAEYSDVECISLKLRVSKNFAFLPISHPLRYAVIKTRNSYL